MVLFSDVLEEQYVSSDQIFNRLGELGYKGTINDRMYQFLRDAGHAGALNDGLLSFFDTSGVSTPDTVESANLLAWYDASDASTVLAEGGSLLGINDKSGNSNNATRTGTITYDTNNAVMNGNPGLVFATNNSNSTINLSSGVDARFMMIVAAYGDGTETTFDAFSDLYGSDRNYGVSGQSVVNTGDYSDTGWAKNDEAVSATVLPLPATVISVTGGSNAPFNMNFIGNRANKDRSWRGVIGEVIMFDAVPSAQDQTALRTSLYSKWGISV